MRFVFRTDADATIGTGHLMRCLALAEALRVGGAECIFLCRTAGFGALAERITGAGHVLLPLPEFDTVHDADGPPHAAWLPGGQARDAAACLAALAGCTPVEWLVVDHYALDHRWQSALRGLAKRIMVIDDLADRVHDCDLLLDQNLVDHMQSRYDGFAPDNCVKLLGPRYALLREEFVASSVRPNPAGETARRILIMFGGADSNDLTRRSVEALIRIGWRGPVDVVAGPLYPRLESLRTTLLALPGAVLHAPANSVAPLMRAAVLALGAPGVASWERCACGLPAVAIAQADNQERIGAALADAGAHWYLGRSEQVSDELLDASFAALLGNPLALASLRRNSAGICDGKGAGRVAALLIARVLLVARPAAIDDGVMLFGWRNDERTRRHFRNPAPLLLEDHLEWFERALGDPSRLLLVITRGPHPVGCVRFDIAGAAAEVSIYLAPSLRGKGLGAGVLLTALDYLRNARPEVLLCRAEVLDANRASAEMFVGCGFRLHAQCFEYGRLAS